MNGSLAYMGAAHQSFAGAAIAGVLLLVSVVAFFIRPPRGRSRRGRHGR